MLFFFFERICIVIGKEIHEMDWSGKLLKSYSFLLLYVLYVQNHLKN